MLFDIEWDHQVSHTWRQKFNEINPSGIFCLSAWQT